ncbi:PREDICTED: signal recognition particle 9 kDa protein isoform X2 [Vollenhovia emeryi]|uniref:signal recognition particle 9 kDa protein isoform X2 n=1 Tax=Vollenhovia emeryi TaxID=411798 RepID=UPI0005F49C33|nr:PREDICTED: signal recognition particle 9 kDa protein isoform X2 [Vollenhovia emeryi]
MTYLSSWEEFERAAERLYLQDPMNTRYTMKYCHSKGILCLKITDNRRVRNLGNAYLAIEDACSTRRR